MQTEPPTQTAEDRATEFVPVSGGADTTSAEALLIAAYILVWAIVLVSILLTARRQRLLEGRLGKLEAQVRQATRS